MSAMRFAMVFVLKSTVESFGQRRSRPDLEQTGALAIGALAVGALAIGALAIGTLVVRRGHVHGLRIDDLSVGTRRVDQLIISERITPSTE